MGAIAAQAAEKRYTVSGGGGLRLHVREWGKSDGPPILLIHGWSQNHLCWVRQYESALADEFRLVAFDLRGHGMSEAPLEAEHYTDGALWADDVAAIIDQLRLERRLGHAVPAQVVGHEPELVGERALVLLGPAEMILRPPVDEQDRRTVCIPPLAHV